MVEVRKPKILVVRDIAEANRIEQKGEYYVDRFSESLGAVVLMRRDRVTARA